MPVDKTARRSRCKQKMPPTRGVSATLRHKYVKVEFGDLVLRGSAESVKIINQVFLDDPSLLIAVNTKLTRTSQKPSKQTYFDLPVRSVVVRRPTADRKHGQSLG